MINWLSLALFSTLFFGIQNFLFQVAAKRKCNSAWVTFSFMLTTTILAAIAFFFQEATVNKIGILAFVVIGNSIAFFASVIARIESLKCIDSAVAQPIFRSSTAVTAIGGVMLFSERLTFGNIIGIILVIALVLLLAQGNGKVLHRHVRRGIFLALISMAILPKPPFPCQVKVCRRPKAGPEAGW